MLIIPKIATPLQHMTTTSLAELPHLSGLNLALIGTTEDHFEITIGTL